jgi:hypothetical protein
MDLIVGKALEKAPELRYQDARELAADLRACKTQLADVALADTVVTDPDAAEPVAGTVCMGAAALQLALSRRFDSAEGVQRLGAAQSVPQSADGVAAKVRQFLRDRDQRGMAAGIAAAAAAAMLIAFV